MTRRAAVIRPPLDPDAVPAIVVHPAVGDDWPSSGIGPVAELAASLPAPADGEPGAWLAVDGGHTAQRGMLGRILGRADRAPRIHVAVRCTALLARGYKNVCADVDGVAYGQVPRRTGNP